jgi:hypothetical protein
VGRDADDVNLVLDRLARGFLGSLKERANIDVEPDIGEAGGDVILAPRSCPSCPSLATSMQGRRPSSRAKASI